MTTAASAVIADYSIIEGAEIVFGVKFIDVDNEIGLDTNVTVSYTVGDKPAVLAGRVRAAVAAIAADNDWDITSAEVVVYAISGLPIFAPDVRRFTITLSSAELLDIFNTPVVAVPAPPANSYIVPVRAFYTYRAGTTPYTVTDLGLYYRHEGETDNLFVLFLDILGEATDYANYENEGQGQRFAVASALGKALTVSCLTAAPTGGDGTLEITTEYVQITP